ncbi:hypothetical protein HNQ10_000580 [Deinococcus metallilatus]|uniref:Uncharacterized protein n=2 Tax=Deinococcus metallilatus TaxID=1211322 RepID=A0ABR6MPA8_9DEIO|nr:hypothetical protein [Deinococcus metallilatus]
MKMRLPAWRGHYPDADFWEPWHMAVLHHGGMGGSPPPVSVMADLYHPARPVNNPASRLLLTFEKRTLLGHLPPEMRLEHTVPQSLLDECLEAPVEDLHAFWGNLDSHVHKHVVPDEQPHLDAAARAIRGEVRRRGLDPDLDPDFFPTAVTDAASYAALARAILFVALLANTPLRFHLYCARADFVPYAALTLNIDMPEAFLQAHGESGTREVVLGLHLAVAERLSLPRETLFVPILNREVNFSTLYAPKAAQSSRLRAGGRSSIVILQ